MGESYMLLLTQKNLYQGFVFLMVIGQGYKQNILAIKLLLTSISFISMNNEIDAFYVIKDEPVKGCLLALRTSILAQDTNINETIKYGYNTMSMI